MKSRFAESARCSLSELSSGPPTCRSPAPPRPARASLPPPSSFCRQQTLDFGGDSVVGRGDLGGPRTGQLAIRPDQVFVEVPARRAGLTENRGDPAVEP